MPIDSAARRLLPHLRRVALARDTETGDGQLLGAFVATRDDDAYTLGDVEIPGSVVVRRDRVDRE